MDLVFQGFCGCQGYEYCFEGLGSEISDGSMSLSDRPTLTNIGPLNKSKDGQDIKTLAMNVQSREILDENLGYCSDGYVTKSVSLGMYRQHIENSSRMGSTASSLHKHDLFRSSSTVVFL